MASLSFGRSSLALFHQFSCWSDLLQSLHLSCLFLRHHLTEQVWAAELAERQTVSSLSPCVERTCRLGRSEPGGPSWWAAHLDAVSDGAKERKKKLISVLRDTKKEHLVCIFYLGPLQKSLYNKGDKMFM